MLMVVIVIVIVDVDVDVVDDFVRTKSECTSNERLTANPVSEREKHE
jgi:hypothetical protein